MQPLPLEKAFNFDSAELDLNRRGRLSPAQKARLARDAWLPFLVLLLPLASCAAITLFGTLNGGKLSISVSIFLLLMLVLMSWIARVTQQKRVRDIESAGVVVAFGKISFTDDKRKLLFLEIDGLTFRLFGWQQSAFDPHKMYRVYYLKEGLQIVSAEIAIRPPDTPRKRRKFPTGVPQS